MLLALAAFLVLALVFLARNIPIFLWLTMTLFLSVIGEELGFIGVLGLLAVFGALVWAGFKIARYLHQI